MGYDNTRNRGSEIRPDVDGRGGSGNSTMIDRDAEKTDTKGEVDVLTGIIEADGAVCQRTVANKSVTSLVVQAIEPLSAWAKDDEVTVS